MYDVRYEKKKKNNVKKKKEGTKTAFRRNERYYYDASVFFFAFHAGLFARILHRTDNKHRRTIIPFFVFPLSFPPCLSRLIFVYI